MMWYGDYVKSSILNFAAAETLVTNIYCQQMYVSTVGGLGEYCGVFMQGFQYEFHFSLNLTEFLMHMSSAFPCVGNPGKEGDFVRIVVQFI